jgi:hypothetical protein
MDNLDRTNVMQAALAKLTLNKQLKSLGILTQNASIDDHETLSQDFRDSKLKYIYICCFVMPDSQSGPTTAI